MAWRVLTMRATATKEAVPFVERVWFFILERIGITDCHACGSVEVYVFEVLFGRYDNTKAKVE